jgi:hypothetical protein
MKITILRNWRWPCRPKHVVKDSENQNTIKLHADWDITCNTHWTMRCSRMLKYSIMRGNRLTSVLFVTESPLPKDFFQPEARVVPQREGKSHGSIKRKCMRIIRGGACNINGGFNQLFRAALQYCKARTRTTAPHSGKV